MNECQTATLHAVADGVFAWIQADGSWWISNADAAGRYEIGEFTGLPDAERLALNPHRAHADASGAEVDLVLALTETVAFNERPTRTAV